LSWWERWSPNVPPIGNETKEDQNPVTHRGKKDPRNSDDRRWVTAEKSKPTWRSRGGAVGGGQNPGKRKPKKKTRSTLKERTGGNRTKNWGPKGRVVKGDPFGLVFCQKEEMAKPRRRSVQKKNRGRSPSRLFGQLKRSGKNPQESKQGWGQKKKTSGPGKL